MADNYQKFSELFTCLTDQEKPWLKSVLENPTPATLKAAGIRLKDIDIEYWPDFGWQLVDDESSLWIFGSEYRNVTHAGEMIKALLARHRPKACFTLTWSETCSKLRYSEFGGGRLFITAKTIRVFRAADQVGRMREQFERAQRKVVGPVIPRKSPN